MRRRGFTLIELLVVIAIIGILAAMLFPVFARARESARKIQCLSNVKNIALAVQMYLTDFDAFPPNEHRQAVLDFFNAGTDGCCCRIDTGAANPYLRWPVVLDEYIKNREVWACPSGVNYQNVPVNPCPNGDWFGWLVSHSDAQYGGAHGVMGCAPVYPPGWGGSITDSLLQDAAGDASNGGFVQYIGNPSDALDRKTSSINDVAKYVVCADASGEPLFSRTCDIAYPDVWMLDRAACNSGVDWANCSWTLDCGAGDPRFATDTEYRKQNGKARHLGGSNLGFADGHAKWFPSETILWHGLPGEWGSATYGMPADQVLFDGVQSCAFGTPTQ